MLKLLNFEIYGQGTPLVLLHGWGWNSQVWRPLVPRLLPYFQLYLVDLPGCGKTPAVAPYSLENIAFLLSGIIPDNSIILGWSLGGLLAYYIAIYFPHKVNKLITVTSSPRFTHSLDWPGIKVEVLENFSKSLENDLQQTLNDFLDLQLRGNNHSLSLLNDLKLQLFPLSVSATHLFSGLDLLKNTDLRMELSRIDAPSLHIFGSHDRIVLPNTSDKLLQLFPTAICKTIPQCGHIPFLTHADIFIEFIQHFMIE